jgi:putative phosphoesterase
LAQSFQATGTVLAAVVSDTHGNIQGLRRLADRLKAKGVSIVLHLGDDYRDLAILKQASLKAVGVPGVYCPEYRNPAISNRLVIELGGVKMLLTHTAGKHRYDLPCDPDPEILAREVQVVLFGHTHLPALELRQGVLWLNPGHLRDRRDRGQPPTYALLTLSPEVIKAEILRLEDDRPVLCGVHRRQA